VYLVGGAVRDLFLGKAISDLDFAVEGSAFRLARRFARRIRGTFVPLDREHDTARVVHRGREVDFAGLRAPDLVTDLQLRDFTINAMAVLIPDGELVDPWGGAEDLERGLIRTALAENIADDPLRVLRAFRFQAQLGFRIDERTLGAVAAAAAALEGVAGERIGQEWRRLLAGADAAAALASMAGCGVLRALFPWWKAGESDLLLERFALLHGWFTRSPAWCSGAPALVGVLRDPDWRAPLLGGALLAPGVAESGDWSAVGRRVSSAAERFRLSRREVMRLRRLLEMLPSLWRTYGAGKLPDIKQLTDWTREARGAVHAAHLLALCCLEQGRPGGGARTLVLRASRIIAERVEPVLQGSPLVSGADLIAEGMAPGPAMGRLLTEVADARIRGAIHTREEALALVRERLAQGGRGEPPGGK
jgi:hypothetical protein